MTILGIETSCDETGAALIRGTSHDQKVTLLSNALATSLSLHAKTGGIIPEHAAREQLKVILPIIDEALNGVDPKKDIDAISVTVGPGLIGSLLVGVETAKTLSYIWNKPIIPVNHLYGHIYANFIADNNGISHSAKKTPEFPLISLVVSGGHTDLVLMKDHSDVKVIGSTRDDAAGEAFDKIGRLLNFPYPAGPKISQLAEKGNPKAINFPRPMMHSDDYDFSFSGLKTAALNKIRSLQDLDDQIVHDLCASIQQAIIDVLVKKTIQAAAEYQVTSILLGGGVAANEKLRQEMNRHVKERTLNATIFVPQQSLCTDNAAMIAAAAYYKNNSTTFREITVDPELYY